MTEAGGGRLLVASLHQAIADLLPSRLEFYEAWLNPAGLRNGRIGLAALAAVLSFLRREGNAYRVVTARAGALAAEWTFTSLAGPTRILIGRTPMPLRVRLVTRLASTMIRGTCGGSRAVARWRRGAATLDIRGSIFCEVRGRVEEPLCGFYAAAVGRLIELFGVGADVTMERCRAAGGEQCLMIVLVGRARMVR